MQVLADFAPLRKAFARQRSRVERAIVSESDQVRERLRRAIRLHHAASAERMRFEYARSRAPDDRAAIAAQLVQPRPSGKMTHALHARHPRVEARPDFALEERRTFVLEVIAGGR